MTCDNKSGYKGVFACKKSGNWRAGIKVEGKSIYNGSHKTKELAALAYDELAIKHFGEFARLNFKKVA